MKNKRQNQHEKFTGHSESLNTQEYYVIKTAEDLCAFREMVNAGNTEINGLLAADINLNPNLDPNIEADRARCVQWTPIGYTNEARGKGHRSYKGTFNGNGHTISGLIIDKRFGNCWGLFGVISHSAVIHSLTVDGLIRCGNNGGGIAGYCCGIIENCTNKASVYGSLSGGICGKNSGIIKNSVNEGKVFGNFEIGGICGNNSVSGSESYIGGICGTNIKFDDDTFVGRGEVSYCTNKGEIIGKCCVGGICGDSELGIGIHDCTNEGAVMGRMSTGGICGSALREDICFIDNCTNKGDVIGGKYTGGICGLSYKSYIRSCKNEGRINGGEHCGTIIGLIGRGHINDCSSANDSGTETKSKNLSLISLFISPKKTDDRGMRGERKIHGN